MAKHHHGEKVRQKVHKIMKEGIRGKKVGAKQAVAVALSMTKKHGKRKTK